MKSTYSNYRLGFIHILVLIFITLKLTGHIDWGWFWVLSPLIFSFVLVFLAFFFKAVAKEMER